MDMSLLRIGGPGILAVIAALAISAGGKWILAGVFIMIVLAIIVFFSNEIGYSAGTGYVLNTIFSIPLNDPRITFMMIVYFILAIYSFVVPTFFLRGRQGR